MVVVVALAPAMIRLTKMDLIKKTTPITRKGKIKTAIKTKSNQHKMGSLRHKSELKSWKSCTAN